MGSFEEKLKAFAVELFKINAIKFGNFKTKVGLMTPVYCDLRVIVSFPHVMENLSELLVERLKQVSPFDLICGVPYTALPIATVVSMKIKKSMVMRRKEAKDYGTKKLIEGVFKDGDTCLIVEDVITSGSSILETVKDLKDAGIKATDAIILLNREQGGEKILKQNGVEVHALLTMTELMNILEEENCINAATVDEVKNYIKSNQVDATILKKDVDAKKEEKSRLQLSYKERSQMCDNAMGKHILDLMVKKQSNLCVAADLTSATDILNLAEEIGPHIALFKLHVDIIEDFHENFIKHLREIADRHEFILFEDRKFADIGKTVQLQFTSGIYRTASWAELVTCHSVTGKGVLDAISGGKVLDRCGVFLLAETSASGNLIDTNYVKATIDLANENCELVVGLVCQNPLFLDKPSLLQLTPGVSLTTSGDNLGQTYNTPEKIMKNGADIAVVGRGITQADNPKEAAQNYQKLLWDAYLNRLQ